MGFPIGTQRMTTQVNRPENLSQVKQRIDAAIDKVNKLERQLAVLQNKMEEGKKTIAGGFCKLKAVEYVPLNLTAQEVWEKEEVPVEIPKAVSNDPIFSFKRLGKELPKWKWTDPDGYTHYWKGKGRPDWVGENAKYLLVDNCIDTDELTLTTEADYLPYQKWLADEKIRKSEKRVRDKARLEARELWTEQDDPKNFDHMGNYQFPVDYEPQGFEWYFTSKGGQRYPRGFKEKLGINVYAGKRLGIFQQPKAPMPVSRKARTTRSASRVFVPDLIVPVRPRMNMLELLKKVRNR